MTVPLFGAYDEPVSAILRVERSHEKSALAPFGARRTDEPSAHSLALTTVGGAALTPADHPDQFVVLQFSADDVGPRLLHTSDVEPSLAGSDDHPDVLARLQMVAFHVARDADRDPDRRATLRITMGKAPGSDSPLDTLFWAVASGLDLYDGEKRAPAHPRDLGSDYDRALSGRPIEIPGGLGELKFEVVEHREPKWWKKVFSFLQSDTGSALTSAVGFPAVTRQAVGFLDDLLNRLDRERPDILFQSRPLTLALSRRAHDFAREGAGEWLRVSALRKGYGLLVRYRDAATVLAHDPSFYLGEGRLVPRGVTGQQVAAGAYDDPFQNLTYAVIRVGLAETRLTPTVSFGS